MKRSLLCIGFAFISLGVADASIAHAAKPILPCQEVVVDNPIASCTMRIHHSKPITLRVKSPIIETNKPDNWQVADDVRPTADMIVFETTAQARPQRIAGVYVVYTRQYTLYIIMSAAASAKVADHAIVLDHASQLAIFNGAIAAKAREVATSMIDEVRRTHAEELHKKDADHAKEIARLGERIEKLQEYILEVANHAIIGAVIQRNRVTPIHQELDQGEGFSIRGTDWVEVGADRILRFDIHNHENDQFPVTRVQVFNEDGTKEHTGTVRIGGDSTRLPPPKDGPLGVVEPKQRVSGAVLIRDHQSLGKSVKLMVHGPEGISPQIRIIPIDPVEPPPLTPKEMRDRQVIVGLRGIAGGCWVPDGIDNSTNTDATICTGVAVQVTKGFSELFAVEAEIAGSGTGDAVFDDLTIDDMSGDLTRSTRQLRLAAGGVLRRGDKVIPTLRFGGGLQVTTYDSEFLVGGVDQPGPDSSSTFETIGYFGGGIDIRLGDHLMTGASVSTVRSLDSTSRTVEAGIYLGYGWHP